MGSQKFRLSKKGLRSIKEHVKFFFFATQTHKNSQSIIIYCSFMQDFIYINVSETVAKKKVSDILQKNTRNI